MFHSLMQYLLKGFVGTFLLSIFLSISTLPAANANEVQKALDTVASSGAIAVEADLEKQLGINVNTMPDDIDTIKNDINIVKKQLGLEESYLLKYAPPTSYVDDPQRLADYRHNANYHWVRYDAIKAFIIAEQGFLKYLEPTANHGIEQYRNRSLAHRVEFSTAPIGSSIQIGKEMHYFESYKNELSKYFRFACGSGSYDKFKKRYKFLREPNYETLPNINIQTAEEEGVFRAWYNNLYLSMKRDLRMGLYALREPWGGLDPRKYVRKLSELGLYDRDFMTGESYVGYQANLGCKGLMGRLGPAEDRMRQLRIDNIYDKFIPEVEYTIDDMIETLITTKRLDRKSCENIKQLWNDEKKYPKLLIAKLNSELKKSCK